VWDYERFGNDIYIGEIHVTLAQKDFKRPVVLSKMLENGVRDVKVVDKIKQGNYSRGILEFVLTYS
jgi:hypothetical protein